MKLNTPHAKTDAGKLGGAVAEWSKALLLRENKQKPKRSQVRPPAWAKNRCGQVQGTKITSAMNNWYLIDAVKSESPSSGWYKGKSDDYVAWPPRRSRKQILL